MRDAQSVLHAKGLHPLNIERTDVQPGQRYIVGHRVVRMGDPLPVVVPVEDYHADPYLASQKRLSWRVLAAMGITLGAGFLWAIGALSLFLFGVILVPAVAAGVVWGWGR